MSKINQIDQPYTNKLKYLQILLIPLVLLGFELISFYISSTSFDSNTISLIYRSTFVLICFIIIFNCSFKKKILKQNYTLFGFWFLYLIRATYDSLLNTDISESIMFLFWTYSFFLCLIPMITLLASINVATINFAKKVFFFMAALVNVLSIINNFSAISLGLFSRYSSNIVLNSITYGQIGLALVIISFSYFINSKKNRIILLLKENKLSENILRTCLNGILFQDKDKKTDAISDFSISTKKQPSLIESEDLIFASKICKHTKSNTIVLAKNKQLISSGTGQTSRVDALKQAIEKSNCFNFNLVGSVMASDAFFPFPDFKIKTRKQTLLVIFPYLLKNNLL